MVRAILADAKTVTRRALKPPPSRVPQLDECMQATDGLHRWRCPYGSAGDQLWVKETFWAYGQWTRTFNEQRQRYAWTFLDCTTASGHRYAQDADGWWERAAPPRAANRMAWWRRPALFMPRHASRLTLERTSTAIGRACELSATDIRAEGLSTDAIPSQESELQAAWQALWTAINGGASWQANPWVWVIGFRRRR
jgi:hypothetical protein